MMNHKKYSRGYFMPPVSSHKWVEKEYITEAPIWCSVDLRDGNQALIIPMSLDEKIEYFQYLVSVGFKEIEVGFPAASETEYRFLRALIEQDLIPEDVTIQVLTQAREHIIRKTFAALEGCKKSIVHLYNSTSLAQREQVFRKSKEEIIKIAVDGAMMLRDLAAETQGNFQFEYSPESFTGTEVDFALDICNAVLDVWQPTADHKVIINLPVTVSMSLPHVYASQIEYMCDNMAYRENVIVSLHPHNDRGCAVADSELGLLAGADRIEGTLFGNGERTGNVDIVTLALNMYTHGVDPKLNFNNLPEITEAYERNTRMHVYERQPYSGALVFAAFSGSHQDAIAKGMNYREEQHTNKWTVPYLPIDPTDLGRIYEKDVIRINSQSGKGGIGYVLEQKYGYDLPKLMREDLGYTVKDVSDNKHKELSAEEVYDIFSTTYVNKDERFSLPEYHFTQLPEGRMQADVVVERDGVQSTCSGEGNGRFDAVCNAIKGIMNTPYTDLKYGEHALEHGSTSKAVAYVGITLEGNGTIWGAGIDNDIIVASVKALVSAINRAMEKPQTQN
ncbi:2-isopropylmalate synthase [Eubacterium aggregans]|uniref:2-isopropylmalate synthase n=1 Tax=Eubacterium aggregans TaxID=81409 RepID=A0A1H3ZU04_9FIRM|nr:2-isopropylmalate synthase [Eubacterium aggregans]SEA26754.1 2-isopropylmalate synthase [Eubacterium aggregans]